MSVPLPDPIAAYFKANTRFDVEAMLEPFADDAVVADEKRTHAGREAIRRWIEEATVANRAVATPHASTSEGDERVVTAKVEGTFPGSPITLMFRFKLASNRIARLAID